jgi:hypothetical protein
MFLLSICPILATPDHHQDDWVLNMDQTGVLFFSLTSHPTINLSVAHTAGGVPSIVSLLLSLFHCVTAAITVSKTSGKVLTPFSITFKGKIFEYLFSFALHG